MFGFLIVLAVVYRSWAGPTTSSPAASGFEASLFCQRYGCSADGEWALQGGGTNRAYRIRGDESVLIELGSRGAELFSAAIGIYGKENMRPDFTDVATDFFAYTIGSCPAVRSALQDLPHRVSGVMEAPPHRCGPWSLCAGRVLADYIVTADR
jgi:hypothetical protein